MEIPVANLKEIPPGSSRLVHRDGKEVALFNVEGILYAVGNRCPHRSGPLVEGRIEQISDPGKVPGIHPQKQHCAAGMRAIRCPIHGWLFDLKTGQCLTRPGASTPSYRVICQEGEIFLKRGEPEAP